MTVSGREVAPRRTGRSLLNHRAKRAPVKPPVAASQGLFILSNN
jgi:hypothetical protein